MTKTEYCKLNQWESSDQVLMKDFNADNAALDAALSGLNTSKADKTALDSKADKTALETLSGTVSGLSASKADKTALDSKADKTALDSKADKTALETLSGTVSGLSTSKADKTALDSKADKTALETLSGTVSGLSTSKADKTALDSKADKTALETLNKTVAEHTTTLASLSKSTYEIGMLSNYTGENTVTVNLGRKPKMVIVGNRLGFTNIIVTNGSNTHPGHTVAMPDYPGYYSSISSDMSGTKVLQITETGFTISKGMESPLAPFFYLALF